MGMNGLYLNLRGREKYGIVEPGGEHEMLLEEIRTKLLQVKDVDGRQVIRQVHRSDEAYSGSEMQFAPDLIVGYSRDYRYSWDTCLGDMGDEIMMDNDSAWSADHCADVSEVPGVLFSNSPINGDNPALIDIGPSILRNFGLDIPSTMQGRDIFT